jgi:hypothetical protein
MSISIQNYKILFLAIPFENFVPFNKPNSFHFSINILRGFYSLVRKENMLKKVAYAILVYVAVTYLWWSTGF